MSDIHAPQSMGQHSAGLRPPSTAPTLPRPAAAPKDESSSIGLVGDSEAAAAEGKIKAFGTGDQAIRREQYARQAVKTGTGACRVRSFHGRLSSQGLEYMDNQINDWLDHSPDVEVKFVTTNVGVFEGKMREPALIVNLWY